MKLTSVEIHPNGSSSVLALSFRDPQALNPFNAVSITGLDPDTIVPKYYGASGSSKFYDMAILKRQIVMVVKLNPNFSNNDTYSSLRDKIYKIIASSRTGKIQLQFKNGTTVVAVSNGFVSRIEAPHFEQKQEVKITIDCDKGMLESLDPTAVAVGGLNPNDFVITDDVSTAPHGFMFDLAVNVNAASIVITDPTDASWAFTVAPVGGFLIGDVLHFSSIYGNKFINLTRGLVTVQLGEVVAPGSIWPILFPGDNHFHFSTPASLVLDAISYYATYWGV